MGTYTPPRVQDVNDLPDVQGGLYTSLPLKKPLPRTMREARADRRPENVLHVAAIEYRALYNIFVACFNARESLPPEVAVPVDAADKIFW